MVLTPWYGVSAIENIKYTLKDDEALVYFNYDFRDKRPASAAEVIRSLFSQLLRQLRGLAIDPGNLIDQLVGERDGGASIINHVSLLTRHISRAFKRLHKPPFIVIDALDECKDKEALLDALVSLQKAGVWLMAASRPLQNIKFKLLGLPSIDMDTVHAETSAH